MSDYPFWPLNKQRLSTNYIPQYEQLSTKQHFPNYHKKSFSSRNLPIRTTNLRQSLYQQEDFVKPFEKRQFLTQRENKFEFNDNFFQYGHQRNYNTDINWVEFGRQNTISNRRQQSQKLWKDNQKLKKNEKGQNQLRQKTIEIDLLRKDKEIQKIEINQLQKRLDNRDKSLGKLNEQYYELRKNLFEYEEEIQYLKQKFYESENQNKKLLKSYYALKDQIDSDHISQQQKQNFCESMYQKYLKNPQKEQNKYNSKNNQSKEQESNLNNVQLQEIFQLIQKHFQDRKIIKISEQKIILDKIKQIKNLKPTEQKPISIEEEQKEDQNEKLIEVNQKLIDIIDHFKIWEEEDQDRLSENMENMNMQLVNIIYNQVMNGDNSSNITKSKQPSFQIESVDVNDNMQITEEEYNKLDQIFNNDNEKELEQELQIKNNQVQDLKEALLQQSEQIEDLQEEKKILETEIQSYNQEIETLNQRIEEIQNQLSENIQLQQKVEMQQKNIKNLEEDNKLINLLQEELEEKEKIQKKFDQICIDNAKTINDLYDQLETQKHKNIQLEKQIANKNYIIKNKDNINLNDSQFSKKNGLPLDITTRSLDNYKTNKDLAYSENLYCLSQINGNYEIDEENSFMADKYLQILLQKVHNSSKEIKKLKAEMNQKQKEYQKKDSDLENQKIYNQKLKIQIYQMEQLKEENIILKKTNQQLQKQLELEKQKQKEESDSEKFSVDDDSESVIYERKSQIIQDKPKDYSDQQIEPAQLLQQNMNQLKTQIENYFDKNEIDHESDQHPLKEMMIKLEQYLLLYKDHKQKYDKRIADIKNSMEKLHIIKKVETMNIKLKEQQERNQERIQKLKNKLSQLEVEDKNEEVENIVQKYQNDLQALEKEQNDYANNIIQLEDYLQENKTGQSLEQVQKKNIKLTEEFNRDVNVLLKLVKKLEDEFSKYN